jgi:hypothetical protein
MKQRTRKKKTTPCPPDDAPPELTGESPRAGLPARDSVVGEETLTSPKGNVYRVLKTNETDAYDKPAPPKRRRRSGR